MKPALIALCAAAICVYAGTLCGLGRVEATTQQLYQSLRLHDLELRTQVQALEALPSLEELRAQIVDVALERAFLGEPLPADEAAFRVRLDEGREPGVLQPVGAVHLVPLKQRLHRTGSDQGVGSVLEFPVAQPGGHGAQQPILADPLHLHRNSPPMHFAIFLMHRIVLVRTAPFNKIVGCCPIW